MHTPRTGRRRRVFVAGSLFSAVSCLLIAAAATFAAQPVAAAHRHGCPSDLRHRTAEQTIREHLALLQAGNLDQAMCDHAEDSVIVLPTQLISGLDKDRDAASASRPWIACRCRPTPSA